MKRQTSDKKILDIIAAVLQSTDLDAHPVLNSIAALVRETGRVTDAPAIDDPCCTEMEPHGTCRTHGTALHCPAFEEVGKGRTTSVRHCTRKPGTCDGHHVWSGWALKG